MEIICTYTQAHVLAGGYVGRERACDSATGGPIYGNHLHMSCQRDMGPERACDSVTGVPNYGNHLHIHPVLCIGMGIWGLREPVTVRQAGVPIYGNHLHMHAGPCFGRGVCGA